MKVLQVFGGLNCGGAETMLMNLYRKIDKDAVQLDFVKHMREDCFYDGEILSLGGKIYFCPKYKVINHFAYKRWWKKFFKEHPEYKVVHSHVRSTASIILKVAKKQGRITISHSHSTSNGSGIKALVKKILQKSIVKWADYYFGCSKDSGEWLFGKGCVAGDKFKIIQNAVDMDKFQFDQSVRDCIRKEFDVEDDFVVGHVGRFVQVKNHTFIIDVFKKVCELKQNAKLILIGGGELEKDIVEKIKELGLEQKVIFAGVRSDVNKLLNAFDCFLFPSVWEGLPVTLVEAQANGLPVVMSDTITDEIALTDLVEKVSLSSSLDVWAKKVLAVKRDLSQIDNITTAGFNINQTSQWLQEFYLGL